MKWRRRGMDEVKRRRGSHEGWSRKKKIELVVLSSELGRLSRLQLWCSVICQQQSYFGQEDADEARQFDHRDRSIYTALQPQALASPKLSFPFSFSSPSRLRSRSLPPYIFSKYPIQSLFFPTSCAELPSGNYASHPSPSCVS